MPERLLELGGSLEVQSGANGSAIQTTLLLTASDSNDIQAVNAVNRPTQAMKGVCVFDDDRQYLFDNS
ncbi:MAG TPA: hypothetical protein VIX91_09535 [Candidatus Acidoferrum sp.]